MKFASARRSSLLSAALAAWCCIGLTSCLEFEESWKASLASAAEKQGKFESIEGPWEGTWKSANDHDGKLRCIITKQENGEYEFHYWAQWQRFLSGSYKAKYKTVVNGNAHTFQGEKDLGKLGGIYKHTGEASAVSITAKYTSSQGDKGTFELKRPKIEEKKTEKEE